MCPWLGCSCRLWTDELFGRRRVLVFYYGKPTKEGVWRRSIRVWKQVPTDSEKKRRQLVLPCAKDRFLICLRASSWKRDDCFSRELHSPLQVSLCFRCRFLTFIFVRLFSLYDAYLLQCFGAVLKCGIQCAFRAALWMSHLWCPLHEQNSVAYNLRRSGDKSVHL